MDTNEIIDLTYLKEISNGDNVFILEMIVVFLQQTPEMLNGLEKHLQDKDWKMLRAVAHKMKPSFSFVGLKELHAIANSIEDNADKEINLEQLPAMVKKIKDVCAVAFLELEEKKKLYQ